MKTTKGTVWDFNIVCVAGHTTAPRLTSYRTRELEERGMVVAPASGTDYNAILVVETDMS